MPLPCGAGCSNCPKLPCRADNCSFAACWIAYSGQGVQVEAALGKGGAAARLCLPTAIGDRLFDT